MTTEPTPNYGWASPTFPSDDLATELDALIDQIDAEVWGIEQNIPDYEIQKDGTDGNGIINFKTQ